MIRTNRVTEKKEIEEVVNLMLGYGSKQSKYVWGIYQDDVLVGGAAVVENETRKNFHLAYKLVPSVSLGKAMSKILKEALEHYKQLTATITLDNVKSRKMARQLGFRVIGTEDNTEILILDKSTWRYRKRWEI